MKNNSLNTILRKPTLASEKFYQKTKVKKLPKEINIDSWPEEWKTVYFKAYPRFNSIPLPKPDLSNEISLKDTLLKRQSKRKFTKPHYSLKKLSSLLYYCAGLKNKKSPYISNRFYPSGGSRYPLEVYLVTLNTEVPKGLYHYYTKSHVLEELYLFDKFDFNKYFNQPFISSSSCLIIISGFFKRTQIKYGDRGYNYIMMEAGHLGQNFYLIATALNLECCAIGGFIENEFNKLLDIDGIDESVIYVLALA